MLRWKAVATYKDGTTREYQFDEISELEAKVEAGPDFNDLVDIRITYNLGSEHKA